MVVVVHLLDVDLLLFFTNMMFFWVLSTGVLVDVLSNVHGDADVPFSLLDVDADVLVEHFAVSSVVADVLGLLDVQFPSNFGQCYATMFLCCSEGTLLMLQPVMSDNLSERALEELAVEVAEPN